MKIISLDLSTHSTGWAVFDGQDLIDYGCIVTSSTDLYKRLHYIVDELKLIFEKHNPSVAIMEEVRPEEKDSKRFQFKTYKALMYLQGHVTTMIHDFFGKTKTEFVYPSEWRAECGIMTGRGIKREELKLADILFAKTTYKVDVNDDIADALGIGYWYLHKNTFMF